MTSIRKAPELLGHAAPSLGAALVAVFIPKCPLCIAAYLAGFGLSAGASHGAAPFVRPMAFTVLGATLLALAFGVWRSRKHPTTPSCCSHRGPNGNESRADTATRRASR